MKKLAASIALAFMMTFGVAGPVSTVYADATDTAVSQACEGISGQAGGTCDGAGGTSLGNIVKAVLNILSVIAGIAAVIMIIIAGLRYITSGGDAQSVAGAKNAIIYAIVGILVVAFSQVIVKVVLAKVQGS